VERVNYFLNCYFRARLKNPNRDGIGGRESRVDMVLENHVGNCFFGASKFGGDIKQFGKVGIEGLSRSGTERAEFPKECHSPDGGVGGVCSRFEFFPRLDGIVYTFDVYLDSIGTGAIDDGQGLQFPLLVVLVRLSCQDNVTGEVVGSS